MGNEFTIVAPNLVGVTTDVATVEKWAKVLVTVASAAAAVTPNKVDDAVVTVMGELIESEAFATMVVKLLGMTGEERKVALAQMVPAQ